MAKTILALILGLFVLVQPAVAAGPGATLRTDTNRRFTYLTFSNIKTVSKVNYVLVYDTATGQKGIEGGFKSSGKTRSTTRRQILGTCSSGKCVYHGKVKNLKLDVTFTLRNGSTVHASKSLP